MKFYGVLQILRKLLPLSQFLVYVDDIGIKMFRNLSTLYNMNSIFSKGGKIGLKLLKPQKIRNFSFFFNFDPFLYFSAPPRIYSEYLYCCVRCFGLYDSNFLKIGQKLGIL